MTAIANSLPTHLGFLTVVQGDGGTLGGYLVTNLWGRPLEFRLSSPVRPNKVQQILYGPTLNIYISAELIGKTLVEKTSTPARVILTDLREVLELRRLLDIPVLLITPPNSTINNELIAAGATVREAAANRSAIFAHPDFLDDVATGVDLFKQIGPGLDITEPFIRVRDAIIEARKMGVSQRAAG